MQSELLPSACPVEEPSNDQSGKSLGSPDVTGVVMHLVLLRISLKLTPCNDPSALWLTGGCGSAVSGWSGGVVAKARKFHLPKHEQRAQLRRLNAAQLRDHAVGRDSSLRKARNGRHTGFVHTAREAPNLRSAARTLLASPSRPSYQRYSAFCAALASTARRLQACIPQRRCWGRPQAVHCCPRPERLQRQAHRFGRQPERTKTLLNVYRLLMQENRRQCVYVSVFRIRLTPCPQPTVQSRI